MKIVGIIAEYNPFHNGHQYHIQTALEQTGADAVVVVMSGDYVQRGTPAVMPKHSRAEMALRCGAAAVFELPVCYATASAELFALGSVSLLDSLGADFLCFGSESGNLSDLKYIADILYTEPEEYRQFLKTYIKEGTSFPAARQRAISSYLTSLGKPDCSSLLGEPNNILGIEYLKALQKLGSSMLPYTIQRADSAYHDDKLHSEFSSATAIRKILEQNSPSVSNGNLSPEFDSFSALSQLETQVPPCCMECLQKQYHRKYPICPDDFSLLLKYKLLTLDEEYLLFPYQDVSDDLEHRIFNLQNEYQSFTQFSELLMTRQFTKTRICRALMHILLEIRKNDMETYLTEGIHFYARLLGFRTDCGHIVSELSKRTRLPLITQPGKYIYPLQGTRLNGLTLTGSRMLTTNVFASNLYNSVITDKYQTKYVHECSRGILKV